jgi:isoquinoline 1-oxidoreductase subunit beta
MRTAIPIATWRAPGHCTASFVIETFIDELAHAGGKDPYRFRRQLIAANQGHDPSFRHKTGWIQALDIVAKASGWGTPLPRGRGRGIGICDRRKHTGAEVQAVYTDSALVTIAATVAEVTVTPDGRVTIDRVFISHDKGVENGVINPTAVEHQITGQIPWAWSSAIQEITVDRGRIVQSNFHDYPMMRMAQFPLHVEIHDFVKGEWIAGAGEEAIPGILPAICNAIYAATGKRIRRLPVSQDDLRWT